MQAEQPVEWMIQLGMEDADAEELDALTRQFINEANQLDDVVYARQPAGGPAPTGAKSADAVTVNTVAMAVVPIGVAKIFEFITEWVGRSRGRTIKFKGKIKGQEVEFEGTMEELKTIVHLMSDQQTR